jgi:hypothetical protein
MNQLQQLNQHMRQQLQPVSRGYIHRILFGGLHIVLERKFDTWRLAIARIGKSPSMTEAETVGRDFCVPDGVTWEWTQKPVRVGGKASGAKYNILECQWVEQTSHQPPATSHQPTEGNPYATQN